MKAKLIEIGKAVLWAAVFFLSAFGAAMLVVTLVNSCALFHRPSTAYQPSTAARPERGKVEWVGDKVTYQIEGETTADVKTIFEKIAPDKAFRLQRPKREPAVILPTENESVEAVEAKLPPKPVIEQPPPVKVEEEVGIKEEESPPPRPVVAAKTPEKIADVTPKPVQEKPVASPREGRN